MTVTSFKFEIMQFPSGERHCRPKEGVNFESREETTISLNFTGSDDFIDMALMADCAINAGTKPTLFCPFFPMARADRRAIPYEAHGVATFIRMIKAAGYEKYLWGIWHWLLQLPVHHS